MSARRVQMIVGVVLAGVCAVPAWADGFLWISAEGPSPVGIYRYNICSGTIDLSVFPADPDTGQPLCDAAGVCNNLAVDGSTLYLGTDDSNMLAKAHPLTGMVFEVSEYERPACGSPFDLFEGGAYHDATDTLWRTTVSNKLLRTSTMGANPVCAPVIGAGFHLLGLEWIGETLYATVLHDKMFGIINDPFGRPSFQDVALDGVPPDHRYDGLAYDEHDDVLYMTTRGPEGAVLWRVDPTSAIVTHVIDLVEVGYPPGAVADSLGWYGHKTCPWDLNGNRQVEPRDVALLLDAWGANACHPANFNGDAMVDAADLAALLDHWGPCPR